MTCCIQQGGSSLHQTSTYSNRRRSQSAYVSRVLYVHPCSNERWAATLTWKDLISWSTLCTTLERGTSDLGDLHVEAQTCVAHVMCSQRTRGRRAWTILLIFSHPPPAAGSQGSQQQNLPRAELHVVIQANVFLSAYILDLLEHFTASHAPLWPPPHCGLRGADASGWSGFMKPGGTRSLQWRE